VSLCTLVTLPLEPWRSASAADNQANLLNCFPSPKGWQSNVTDIINVTGEVLPAQITDVSSGAYTLSRNRLVPPPVQSKGLDSFGEAAPSRMGTLRFFRNGCGLLRSRCNKLLSSIASRRPGTADLISRNLSFIFATELLTLYLQRFHERNVITLHGAFG
jgi:hypothetical protein